MSTHFYRPVEKRYAQYPRRYLNEYHSFAGGVIPTAKGACVTEYSARRNAVNAVEQHEFKVVRIFDRKTGQYVHTYKKSVAGIIHHEGYVK